MQYTPYQYRKVEQQFLQQFELRSLEFYDQNVNSQSLIQYKKLINLMQSNRKETFKKKKRLQILKSKAQSSQFDSVISQLKEIQQNQIDEEEYDGGNGFYITENLPTLNKKPIKSQKNEDISLSQVKSVNSRIRQSALNFQSRIYGSQTNENLNFESIQDRIYTQYNVLESLNHEQSQVQEAIFCFKTRIIDLQQQLSSQNMKSKEVQRLFVQNNNEMMHVKYTNQEVKSAFSKTKKHFNLDLQGRKQIQQKFSQTNKSNFQETIINNIYLQKMRQKISQQQEQLIELQQKKEELDSKEKKYQSIYEKQQQFLKTYDTIMKIKPDDFMKDKIVSILDKEFDRFQENQSNKKTLKSVKSLKKINLKSKSSCNLLTQSNNQEESLTKIVSSLISLYKNMKNESIKKTNEFKILISEKEQKQKQLIRILQKFNSTYDCYEKQIQPKSFEDRSQLNKAIKRSNQIQQKCFLLNSITINIEERISFWLSKHLILMETIMKSFLRSDKNSIKFFQDILKKTFEVPQLFKFLKNKKVDGNFHWQERQLHIQDSRNLLVNCFQNWQNYLEYLKILHESKYIQNFLSQKKLLTFFKRIIKTKLKNKVIPTQIIFQKAISIIFQESVQYHLGKISKLLEIFKEIYSYMQKVKQGSIKIHCSIIYDSFQNIGESNSKQEASKNTSQKQLIRTSSSKKNQKPLLLPLDPFMKTQKNLQKEQEMFHTFSSTQKHIQPNNQNQMNIMSKLKKRKKIGSAFNIHQFYEQMREEIQKVHKINIH